MSKPGIRRGVNLQMKYSRITLEKKSVLSQFEAEIRHGVALQMK